MSLEITVHGVRATLNAKGWQSESLPLAQWLNEWLGTVSCSPSEGDFYLCVASHVEQGVRGARIVNVGIDTSPDGRVYQGAQFVSRPRWPPKSIKAGGVVDFVIFEGRLQLKWRQRANGRAFIEDAPDILQFTMSAKPKEAVLIHQLKAHFPFFSNKPMGGPCAKGGQCDRGAVTIVAIHGVSEGAKGRVEMLANSGAVHLTSNSMSLDTCHGRACLGSRSVKADIQADACNDAVATKSRAATLDTDIVSQTMGDFKGYL